MVHSGLTGGAFEMLMRAAEARGLPATTVRLGLEVGVLALGTLLERDDVIIVASVSCIYGIGSPETYSTMTIDLAVAGLEAAVRRRGARNEHVRLEASGGVDLERVRAIYEARR